MKRTVSLVIALIMVCSLAACGKSNRYTSSDIPQDGDEMDFTTYVTPVNTASPTATPEPTPAQTPVPTPTAAPTPAPTITVVNNGYVTITKSPTSEVVDAGGKASFVAYGSNFTAITWTISNADSSINYNASEAPNHFPGLGVTGQGSSTLTLSNIPSDLNGWKVQAIFSGTGGPLYTNIAYITVNSASAEEQIAKDYSTSCRNSIATAASSYGFTTSDITSFSYVSGIGDFSLTLTKGNWTVYGEFLADYSGSSCEPLAITVYYGSNNMTETYPLLEQTLGAFYNVLSQLS